MSSARKSALAAGASLAAAATVALWTAQSATRPTEVDAEADRVAHEATVLLNRSALALHARLSTLATLPRLAAAVSTDADTVRDLSQEELAFQPRADEIVVIAQLFRSSAPRGEDHHAAPSPSAGPVPAPVVLLLLPAGSEVPPLDTVGARLRVSRGHLVMSDAIRIIPRARAEEMDGVIAATQVIDLGPLSAALGARGESGRLRVGAGELVPLGADRGWDGQRPASALRQIAIPGVAGAALLEIASVREAPRSRDRWMWPLLLALAGAVLAVRAASRARRRPPVAAMVSPDAESNLTAASLPRRPSSSAVPSPAPSRLSGPNSSPLSAPEQRTQSRGSHFSSTGSPPHGTSASFALRTAPPELGQVGRYRFIRRLGTGGMAEVFLARLEGEAGFSKLFAVKVLQPAYARQAVVVDTFLDEARLASQLNHPNVVQVMDLGNADGDFFIAMEFVDGADLFRLIEIHQRLGRSVPIPVAIGILRRICDGLHAAHTMQTAEGFPLELVHRDVKSANVFVSRDGAVKIGDFGIAKANDTVRVGRTEIGMVKGTPGYMAPEQRLNQIVDAGADVYGVGAIAYELLSGVPINLDLAVLAQKGTEGWPHLAPLSAFRADVPVELTSIVFRALAFDRADRFPSCADLELALETVASRIPGSATIEKTIAQWIAATLEDARELEGSESTG